MLDLDQRAADALAVGEILELAQVSFKDNRVDLRTISLEAHKVTRGTGLLSRTKREPVSTNFKFFLPFPKSKVMTKEDLPEVFRLVEAYLKPFPDERAARAFVAQAASSAASTPRREGAERASSSKKEIKAGMTPLQVIEVLGKPANAMTFENRERWSYPDLTIVFENGRVKDVKF